jgi:hypothetical protein
MRGWSAVVAVVALAGCTVVVEQPIVTVDPVPVAREQRLALPACQATPVVTLPARPFYSSPQARYDISNPTLTGLGFHGDKLWFSAPRPDVDSPIVGLATAADLGGSRFDALRKAAHANAHSGAVMVTDFEEDARRLRLTYLIKGTKQTQRRHEYAAAYPGCVVHLMLTAPVDAISATDFAEAAKSMRLD